MSQNEMMPAYFAEMENLLAGIEGDLEDAIDYTLDFPHLFHLDDPDDDMVWLENELSDAANTLTYCRRELKKQKERLNVAET